MQQDRTESRNRSALRFCIGAILLILLVAAGLRLWNLPDSPPGPHYDEAANGILAAEIADGIKRPVFIPSYTGKEVLFFYAAAAAMRVLDIGVLALRSTAAVVGILTVAATAWMAYELFADDEADGAHWLAALTAALLATSFWHVLLSRIGFRAVTQPLLQALTLGALWRGLRRDDWRWLALGGVFCGLTGYTYLAARAFPLPLAIALLVLIVFDRDVWMRRLGQAVVFDLVSFALFVPLGLYFAQHPDVFTNRMRQVGPGDDWNAAVDGISAAFKMLFVQGDPYIRFNLPSRPLFGPVVAFFLLVGLTVTIWRLFRPRQTAASHALERARETLILTWVPIMLLPTALAVNEITPSNLRAVGLIPIIFVFPARGFWAIVTVTQDALGTTGNAIRITDHVLRFAPLLLTCLLLFATGFITARAYFREYVPRTDLYEASDGDMADIATYLNQADLTESSVYVGSIHYRHPTLAFLADAYSQVKWLVGASTAVYPATDEALYLFPRSAEPDKEWFARVLPAALPVAAPTATDGAPAFTGFFLTAPPPVADKDLADFSGVVRLLDYQVEGAMSGDMAQVTLTWQILAPPPYPGLMPFYHLVDGRGYRWGQAEPFHYSAEDWTPGEVVADRVRVPIAPGAPPGDYILETGFYSRNADARVAVIDDAGNFIGTTVPLTITVGRAVTPPNQERLGIRQRLDLETDTGLTLLGANLNTTEVRPGERLELTLFWRSGPDQRDYTVNLGLRNESGDAIDLYSGGPVHGTYPTSRWTDAEIVVDHYNPRLPLAAADPPPGDYALVLSVTDADGESVLSPVALGTVHLIATDRTFKAPAMGHTQKVTLGDQAELLGYDLDQTAARPDGKIILTLFWRALREMDESYTVFTHVLGPDGQVVAQQDNPPINGTYPTTLWLTGEVITDPYIISLPADLASGAYPIQVGFYLPDNGLRLADPVVLDTVVTIEP
jgi:hypothetical protein